MRRWVPVGALALLAAGCGGGGRSPAVASVASSTTAATTTQEAAPAQGGIFTGHRGIRSMAILVGSGPQGAKFSACIRAHGVSGFPDPNSQGVIEGAQIDPGSPTWRSALRACEKLLPNGSLAPTPAEEAQRRQEMLAFSRCMRAHGVKDFPDPTDGGQLELSHLDPNDPVFQRAQTACQRFLPAGAEKELPRG